MATEVPYWWLDAPLDDSSTSKPAPDCDVAIIGAGYTGLSAAIVLAQAGKSVQVFDAMRPGEGASTRNGGIASGNLRLGLSKAIELLGRDKGTSLYREGKLARDDLAKFVKDENIDCDWQANGRFTGVFNRQQFDNQQREIDLLNEQLDIGAYMVDRRDLHDEVGTGSYLGGVVRPDLAMLHPAKLHAGLFRIARRKNASVFGNSPITDYRRSGSGFELTLGGRCVRAGKVIVAANGYADASNPWLQRRMVPVKSRIVVTGEIPQELMEKLLPKRRAMGETRRLFRYYRPTPDGKRVLLGGREKVFSDRPEVNSRHVYQGLLELFPELAPYGMEFSWNGNVAFSREELPLLFEKDGVIYACGFSGSGVVWARWLGKKAAHKILGDPEAETAFEIEPPAAVPFYRGTPWFLPFALCWFGLRDFLELRRAGR